MSCTGPPPPSFFLTYAHTHPQTRARTRTRTLQPPPHAQDPSWYAVRYHDIRRNEYIRYFRGHTGPLNTLAMSPKNDVFMSASQVRGADVHPSMHAARRSVAGLRYGRAPGLQGVPAMPRISLFYYY